MNQVDKLQLLVSLLSGAIVFILFVSYVIISKIHNKHKNQTNHYENLITTYEILIKDEQSISKELFEINNRLKDSNKNLLKFNDHYFRTVINDIPFDKYPEESDKAAEKQFKSILTNANRLIEEGKLNLQQTRKLAQLRIDANEIVNSNSTSTCGSPKPRTVASSEPLDSEDKTQHKSSDSDLY